MNVPRYDFACAEVNGVIYAVGGYGADGDSLSCAEMYNPETEKWTLIESLRRPRWGCFACGFEGKLYVMGGRSSFTIGNSRFVHLTTHLIIRGANEPSRARTQPGSSSINLRELELGSLVVS
ncbi:putative kelch-type beta propeller [Helianthus annuus]|nr:putative kelch-type beta propeller [Helianthus annuus]